MEKRIRYDRYLAAAGVGLPLVATIYEAFTHFGSVAPAALLRAHLGEPLLWLMDTTPFVLGALGRVIVRQHRDLVAKSEEVVRTSGALVALEQARREGLERTARELAGAARALLGSVSEFTATTSEAVSGVRDTRAAVQQLSQGAASAALTADTVIGLAHRSAGAVEDPEVERLAAAAKEIARAAQAQEGAIERVLSAMSAITHATEATVTSTRAVEREARALSDLAASLQAAVKA